MVWCNCDEIHSIFPPLEKNCARGMKLNSYIHLLYEGVPTSYIVKKASILALQHASHGFLVHVCDWFRWVSFIYFWLYYCFLAQCCFFMDTGFIAVVLLKISGRIWIRWTMDPFYLHRLTLIPAWISIDIPCKFWNEITFPFPKFHCCTIEFWGWMY